MAIYHFSGTVVSRSSGKSAIASAAYRSGEKLYDERQERVADYSRKQDVVFKEVMLPEGAPEWMKDREKLWNAVELAENRKDSQLAREFNFSLPREFTKEQNVELAREFVQNEFVSKGMVADLCIHDGKTKEGEEQPHAHVMLTLRRVTEEGFGLKERSWNAKENLLKWREAWADFANKHLALNGIDQKIDYRTLEEQGIDLEAQKKIGPDILRIHEVRMEEHHRIAKENGEKISEDPNIALNAVTYHNSTFTHQDLARFINRHTADVDQFQIVYEKVKASDQIVVLVGEKGVDLNTNLTNRISYLSNTGEKEAQETQKGVGGNIRFTTKEMLALESKMLSDATTLKDSFHITPRSDFFELGECNLAPQQKDALEHIIGAGDLKCLIGYAGTGKSHLLSAAREIWEEDGYRVHGATLSGIAAENLEAASGIESRTLASRSYYWDRGEEKLSEKDVLVIDEAGMLGSRQVARVLEEAKEGGAKVVFIGDPQQLQAIEAGAAFRAISEQVGFLELTEIRRQREPWQQEATKEFALQNTAKALSLYEEHGCVHFFETQAAAKEALVEKWNDNRTLQPNETQIMLSYTRRDAQELNEMARYCRTQEGELGEDQKLQTSSGSKEFATGDRIYFLQNDRGLGVKNGTLGTIEHIGITKTANVCEKEKTDKEAEIKQEAKTGIITVRLDKEDHKGSSIYSKSEIVKFNLEQYGHITHGYAATIHKAQGVTVDESHVLASKHMDSHAAYVGVTRHKERTNLYWSKEEFANKRDLEQVLGRDRSKDVSLDYINSISNTNETVEGKDTIGNTRDKTAAELVNELSLASKEYHKQQQYGQEYREESYLQELRKLGQEGQEKHKEGQDSEAYKYLQELKEGLQQQEQDIASYKNSDDFKSFQERFEREQLELATAQKELTVSNEAKNSEMHLNDTSIKDSNKPLDRDAIALDNFQKEYERLHPDDAERAREEIQPMSPSERRAEQLIEKHHEFEERYHDLQERGGSRYNINEAKHQMERCAHEICKDKDAMDYLQKNDKELFKEMEQTKELEKVLERERGFELSL